VRKGRPLLLAATGVALVSFAQCAHHHPVGNLSTGVQPQADAGVGDAGVDAATLPEPPPPQHPVGNLRPPPPTTPDPDAKS
jgi:hypothetical protein